MTNTSVASPSCIYRFHQQERAREPPYAATTISLVYKSIHTTSSCTDGSCVRVCQLPTSPAEAAPDEPQRTFRATSHSSTALYMHHYFYGMEHDDHTCPKPIYLTPRPSEHAAPKLQHQGCWQPVQCATPKSPPLPTAGYHYTERHCHTATETLSDSLSCAASAHAS